MTDQAQTTRLATPATAGPTASLTRATCHSQGARLGAGPQAAVIALVGAPNVGKSTLFNAVTGARRTVGNWPGTTVEVGSGVWPATEGLGQNATVLDLPGAYSLDALSPDEALTRELLLEAEPAERPDLVVIVVDAANLARSSYLLAQLREQPLRVVVALTMTDIAARRGIQVDPRALAQAAGCPVVAVDPRQRHGGIALGQAVAESLDQPLPSPRPFAVTAPPTEPPDGELQTQLPSESPPDADLDRADERFSWIESLTHVSTRHTGQSRGTWSDRVDRWATAPVIGPLIFLAVMWLVFQITTVVAAPLQDLLDGFFSGPVTSAATAGLTRIGLGETPVLGFVTDGVIAGVGMLLTFVPLMALMFLLLAVLEDSGYMARAAVVTDRMMRRLGLPGRAFLPLVVGFGCNVPAISATRILGNARQRLLVALLVPFTSCSARLTVYVMLATIFFPANAGTVVFALYVVSVALVVLVGMALRSTLWRSMGQVPLVLDLPAYQRPSWRLTLSAMWVRLAGFLRTAAGIIVATVAVVWLLQSVPVRGGASFGEAAVEDTAYAAAARTVAPVFGPAGFAEWETTSALMVGFVAKEAVVSSWAQTYAVAEPDAGASSDELGEHVRAAFERSSGGHPLPAVLAFMVFLLAYTPCVATLAAQRREIGTRWTAFGVAVQLGTAWLLAVAVFQIGRLVA